MTEASETELKTLNATVEEKEAAWKIAEDDVEKSVVHPPINGTIEKRYVTNLLYATTGMQLATIVDRSFLKLRFKVAERDASAVKEGGLVKFTVPAWPSRTFEGEVYHIEEQLDRDARTLTVFAKVTKDINLLHSGYFAAVNIVTGSNQKAVVVPMTAVLPTEKGFVAFVVKDGKAERRVLKTGLSVTSDQLEILSGLDVGDSLVVEGSNALLDGVGVKVLDGAAKSEPAAARTEENKDKVAGAEKPAQ
jgi:multidrug efflux system membrane fusion protein